MKPLMIKGHTRPLTKVFYNREGDLLFSTSKDKVPSVWYSHNGERLGTFAGEHMHNGTVWTGDVDYTSKYLVTGSADNSMKLWDVETGNHLCTITENSPIRTAHFSYDGKRILYSTDNIMGQPCLVKTIDVSRMLQEGSAAEAVLSFDHGSKATCSQWGLCDETIVTADDKGYLRRFSATTGDMIGDALQAHSAAISDMQYGKDLSTLITASKDESSKLYDADSLQLLKIYEAARPINSACVSPIRDHVILGGGQEARDVTTTHGKQGKFDALFFHMIFEEEMGSIKGHFGPINTLAFHPEGTGYTSGGEDGYIRVHQFDDSYFEFAYET